MTNRLEGVAAGGRRPPADRQPDAWWRALNRDSTWVSVLADLQRELCRQTDADMVSLWAQVPPHGEWLRVNGPGSEDLLLRRASRPYAEMERRRTAQHIVFARTKGPYREALQLAGLTEGWLLPLVSPPEVRSHEHWLGAVGLYWKGDAPATAPEHGLILTGLWYLLRQHLESAYTETLLESATAMAAPATPRDWERRMAAMLARLGGDHWALYRVGRTDAGALALALVTEQGTAVGRGTRLVNFMNAHPERFRDSALMQAVDQRRSIFVENVFDTNFAIPDQYGGEPLRSGFVMPLGEQGEGGFGVLSVYWAVPDGWQRFGLSMRPWDAFRRVASEWWQTMHTARDAVRDPLTGALNRRGLAQEWARTTRAMASGVVGIVDVDHFSDVNNRWGHSMGDEMLRALADALAQTVERYGGCTARWGGDEFVLTLPRTADWCQLGHEVQTVLDAVAADRMWPHRMTLSGGASRWSRARDDWGSVLARADRNLYEAKRRGRALFVAP